jgi:hypothetical protein
MPPILSKPIFEEGRIAIRALGEIDEGRTFSADMISDFTNYLSATIVKLDGRDGRCVCSAALASAPVWSYPAPGGSAPTCADPGALQALLPADAPAVSMGTRLFAVTARPSCFDGGSYRHARPRVVGADGEYTYGAEDEPPVMAGFIKMRRGAAERVRPSAQQQRALAKLASAAAGAQLAVAERLQMDHLENGGLRVRWSAAGRPARLRYVTQNVTAGAAYDALVVLLPTGCVVVDVGGVPPAKAGNLLLGAAARAPDRAPALRSLLPSLIDGPVATDGRLDTPVYTTPPTLLSLADVVSSRLAPRPPRVYRSGTKALRGRTGKMLINKSSAAAALPGERKRLRLASPPMPPLARHCCTRQTRSAAPARRAGGSCASRAARATRRRRRGGASGRAHQRAAEAAAKPPERVAVPDRPRTPAAALLASARPPWCLWMCKIPDFCVHSVASASLGTKASQLSPMISAVRARAARSGQARRT